LTFQGIGLMIIEVKIRVVGGIVVDNIFDLLDFRISRSKDLSEGQRRVWLLLPMWRLEVSSAIGIGLSGVSVLKP